MRLRRLALLPLALALLTPAPLPGQARACVSAGGSFACNPSLAGPSNWRSDALALGVNAAIGGLAAGVVREVRDGSFWDGFRRGSMGGAVAFAGKRLAVESFAGAGFAGREVAAVGSSMIRNAAAGIPGLREVVLPLGPTRLYVRPRAATPVRLQVDVAAVALLVVAASDPELKFEPAASLSAGAFVFQDPESARETSWIARETAGVIRVRGHAWAEGGEYRRKVLAHERVHVLQYDQGFLLGGEPLEGLLLPRLPGGAAVGRWLDLALETPVWGLSNRLIPYSSRPWEAEAFLLSRTREYSRHGQPVFH